MDIENKLIEIFKRTLKNIDSDSLQSDTDLISIGVNSINFIRTVVEIEDEFGFEFENENLNFNKFRNINSLVAFIKNSLE